MTKGTVKSTLLYEILFLKYYERNALLYRSAPKAMKKTINPSVSMPAYKAPELPELNASQRANLLAYLITTKECMDKLVERSPEDDAVLNAQCVFEVALGILLDGAETVDEYLARDTKVKHSIICGFIVSEENGVASFICPNCGMQTCFPATPENMKCIEDTCVPDCCPVCNAENISLTEKFRNIILGENLY